MTMHLTYVTTVPQHTDDITTVKKKIGKDHETNALVGQDVVYPCGLSDQQPNEGIYEHKAHGIKEKIRAREEKP